MFKVADKRLGNLTAEQKKELVDFIEKHPNLKSGKFNNSFTFKHAQALWMTITDVLNAMPGVQKDWKLWRKTWQDLKVNAKRKNPLIKTYQERTGGGPPILNTLSNTEEKIINLLGPVAVTGHPNIVESEALFEDEEPVIVVDMEHDYCPTTMDASTSLQNKNEIIPLSFNVEDEKENIPVTSGNVEDAKSLNANSPQVDTNVKKRKCVRVQRLEHTITATDKLANLTERKLVSRENYLKEKLSLYREDIAVRNKIAAVLENIAKA